MNGPGNESSSERTVQGTKVPGNEKYREQKFPIGTIRSWERKVLGTKSPGTKETSLLLGLKCSGLEINRSSAVSTSSAILADLHMQHKDSGNEDCSTLLTSC